MIHTQEKFLWCFWTDAGAVSLYRMPEIQQFRTKLSGMFYLTHSEFCICVLTHSLGYISFKYQVLECLPFPISLNFYTFNKFFSLKCLAFFFKRKHYSRTENTMLFCLSFRLLNSVPLIFNPMANIYIYIQK